MEITDFVLVDVRKALNIEMNSDVFDGEIIPHITASLGKLSQNGVGVPKVINPTVKWTDVINPIFVDNEDVFSMLPLYVILSTKIIFDPPPPSAIPYYQSNLDDLLWRLRLIYDISEVR